MITTPLVTFRLLRRTEAARHIHDTWGYPCSPKTLAKYAVIGGGPRFRKAGRYPLYHADDLDDWVNSKLSNLVTSTSSLAIENATQVKTARATPKAIMRSAGFKAPSLKPVKEAVAS